MQQKILKVLCIILAISLIIAACLFHAIYVAPEHLVVEYDSISSTEIPESLDNVTIGFFSDVYYGEYMDEERFTSMIEKINNANVDIVLFGGDLFYDPANQEIDADTKKKMIEMLSSIKAPLGKFYVLGDVDKTNKDTTTLIKSILYNSGFENAANKSIKLHNHASESIKLIGIDNEINGSPNVTKAFKNISKDSFNIVFTHTPDTLAQAPENIIDVAFAGHSLGGSIRLPIFGSFKQIEGATKYHYGTYSFSNTFIRVSNGMGTHVSDMRLFCNPQFNVFVLHHEEVQKEEETTTDKTKTEDTTKEETKTEEKKEESK